MRAKALGDIKDLSSVFGVKHQRLIDLLGIPLSAKSASAINDENNLGDSAVASKKARLKFNKFNDREIN